jgi:hypothetical protein
MTRYWVIRTDKAKTEYVAGELAQGRLRQGWGWTDEQDLRAIAADSKVGKALNDAQKSTRRGNRRLLDSEPDGVRQGDLVLLPHQPALGSWSLVRVAGPYRWEHPTELNSYDMPDYGHILPVEMVSTRPIHPFEDAVSARLRHTMRNMSRMWNIDALGPDVEELVRLGEMGDRSNQPAIEPTNDSLNDRAVPTPAPSVDPEPMEGHLGAGGSTEPVIAAPVEAGRPPPVAPPYAPSEFGSAVYVLDRLLESIGGRAAEIDPTRIVIHWPHVGRSYRGTVILGQSLYGWADDFPVGSFRDPAGRADAITVAQARNVDRPDPNDWLLEVPAATRNSPFWTASRLIADAVQPDGATPWYSRIAWVNLFPCAPADPRGNPSGALKEAQDPFVGELLSAHVERLNATRIVAFVGPFWWPAAGPAGLADLPEVPQPLMRAGVDAAGRTWVVGWHPAGASRHGWGPARYAELIIQTIENVERAANVEDAT